MEILQQNGASVTMKTVARHAGVTQATVSMSLANNPRISRFTRERVQAVALELGYRPNPYLAMLMRVRRRSASLNHRPVFAVVCAHRGEDGWKKHPDPAVRRMREGVFEQAAKRGYCAQEFWLHRDGMSNQRFSDILWSRGIRGVLLGPLDDAGPPPQLDWKRFAVVSLSVPHPALSVTRVCHDHFHSAQQILRACRERGYVRPGLVLHAMQQRPVQERWHAGFLVAAQESNASPLAKPLWVEDWDDPSVTRWLGRENPDVIISTGSHVLRRRVVREGWRVPRDRGMISLSCSPDDALSGVAPDGNALGSLAAEALIGMIERYESGLPVLATTMTVEGRWNEGSTLRLPRIASAA